ncbi:inositol monophosphatase [Solemya pervernicosa gill symbiont]|uniref:Inositol monophosphatase n=2 Tax=Gammaproteobacteria incertae sedis TaxID=118884 RepID=A0A1T2L3K7_9GAMM|nr:inositol monophosphatase family protein [Candidatus Reidiella endopervernicosa]OOZ39671.1 inositol monophosphatase [Solemya pervernicosa gill symbiont]QKQ27766.1 inositol monophosphatase family protein [Candidatus Reidiella endopervernicosa]
MEGSIDLKKLQQIVITAAREELLPRFEQIGHELKSDGSVVTEADIAMQQRLERELAEAWPQYGLLGEEMSTEAQQALLDAPGEGLWCLDPLDGTSNYASGIGYYCVSLALLDNEGSVLALIYDPVRDDCFTAVRGEGARLNGEPLLAPKGGEIKTSIAEIDLKRLDSDLAARIGAEHPFRSQRNFGSGALDWCWLAAGRYQLYLHGGQKLWDYAAGSLILAEAGGAATTFEGESMFADEKRGTRSVVSAVNGELQQQWLAWVKGARDGQG